MRLMLAIVLLALGAASAHAGAPQAAPPARDIPFLIPPTAENKAVTCRDFRNRLVRTVDVPDLGDAGRAEFVQGNPIIMFDPALMAGLPDNLQVFFKLHECGHHALGHLFAPSTRSEKEADCWAIKQGRTIAGFTKDDIIAWKPHFATSRGDTFGHLPGPQRVEFLLGCFDEE